MLFLLGEVLQPLYGPFRLLTSHIFLAGAAIVLSGLLTWVLLPALAARLPRDRGRAYAVDTAAAVGKPTSAGLVFVLVYIGVALIVVPWHLGHLGALGVVLLAMVGGFLDDRTGLSEYWLAAIDFGLALLSALAMCGVGTEIWLPFVTEPLLLPRWVCVSGATALIWMAINATNCTDGVDGLSGSLAVVALTSLGGLLYFVLGHDEISAYLLLPHYPDGATWAISAFAMIGCLTGYLWYNAHPSEMLMGDAGSRAVGLLLGILVIKSGNPFMLLIVSGVLLVNGGHRAAEGSPAAFLQHQHPAQRPLSVARPPAPPRRLVQHPGTGALHPAAGDDHHGVHRRPDQDPLRERLRRAPEDAVSSSGPAAHPKACRSGGTRLRRPRAAVPPLPPCGPRRGRCRLLPLPWSAPAPRRNRS